MKTTMAGAIRDALGFLLRRQAVLYGLGTPDGVFGTTTGLSEEFPGQVFDAPCSEEALTGIALGLSLRGVFPVLTHQRSDFLLCCANQLINNVAKWHQLYGTPTPMIIRSVLGRGWGQGCTHGQDLVWMFNRVEGLQVVVPSNPADAKGLLLWATGSEKPVLFFEHRWLHAMEADVPVGWHEVVPAVVPAPGSETCPTLYAYGYAYHLAREAQEILAAHGVTVDVFDTMGAYVAGGPNRLVVLEQPAGSFVPAGPRQGVYYNTAETIANDVFEWKGSKVRVLEVAAPDQNPMRRDA